MNGQIIELFPSDRNRKVIATKFPDRWAFLGTSCSILTHLPDGTPVHMTLGFLRSLADEGYVGLDRIPRECIIR